MRVTKKRDSSLDQLVEEERLILAATELVEEYLAKEGISRSELAARLGKSKGHVSQLLSGQRNLTLRTLAELMFHLGARVRVDGAPRNEVQSAKLQARRVAVYRYGARREHGTAVGSSRHAHLTCIPGGKMDSTWHPAQASSDDGRVAVSV